MALSAAFTGGVLRDQTLAAIETKKQSLANIRDSESSAKQAPELDDPFYCRHVLQLESSQTEDGIDSFYHREALDLGIELAPDDLEEPSGTLTNSASTATVTSANVRSRTSSRASQSTGITAPSAHAHAPPLLHSKSSPPHAHGMTLRRSLSFTEYERFLAQAQSRDLAFLAVSPVSLPTPSPALSPSSAPSLFSVSTRKSYFSIKRGIGRIGGRFGKSKANLVADDVKSCIRCRDDFKKNKSLHNLPCSHIYCDACLRVFVTQAMQEEAQMPPKCCLKPIPAFIIKSVLDPSQQQRFLDSILQYSTPTGDRIYCPEVSCQSFIAKGGPIDPKHPFDVECTKCQTRVCRICKRDAHVVGQDCPGDWELDTVHQMGKEHNWRRCYKCNNLVQLTQGLGHMTCRCNAQFCYICGGVWDKQLGCPNNCNGEEQERQRKRDEEELKVKEARDRARQAALEYATSAEAMAAVRRSRENKELTNLRIRQVSERDRYIAFEQKQKWALWTRHGQEKIRVMETHAELESKMRERHNRNHTNLEDRQVAAEMELRQTLKQERKACLIRLRHMEAYCDGLNSGKIQIPGRVVTERDLRELGQQYNLRDDMERMHQSRINVLREKQAKQLDDLTIRQEEEYQRLDKRLQTEAQTLETRFGREEAMFQEVFGKRKRTLGKRWTLMEEITRKLLEQNDSVSYGPLPSMEWPEAPSPRDTTTGETNSILP
ncbi:MAG: hypothetical protein M1814_000622 [Vezdaea aestivalis]|nr:MAG: hypothetical protein M1814_000622 [Vezdaea aestivalis]